MCFHDFLQMVAVNRSICFRRVFQPNVDLQHLAQDFIASKPDHLVSDQSRKREHHIFEIDFHWEAQWHRVAQDLHLGICNALMTLLLDLGRCPHMLLAEPLTVPYLLPRHTALCHHRHRLPAMVAELGSHPLGRAPAPLVNATVAKELQTTQALASTVPQSDRRRN